MIRATLGLFSTCCPHCKSIDYRSADARNVVEMALQWLLQPCWCALCGHRFFLFRWQVSRWGNRLRHNPVAVPLPPVLPLNWSLLRAAPLSPAFNNRGGQECAQDVTSRPRSWGARTLNQVCGKEVKMRKGGKFGAFFLHGS